MSETLQIINIIVLAILIGFAINNLSKSDRARKKKKTYDAEKKQWERGVEIVRYD